MATPCHTMTVQQLVEIQELQEIIGDHAKPAIYNFNYTPHTIRSWHTHGIKK